MNHYIEFVGRDHTGITTVVTAAGVIDVRSAIDDIRSGRASFFAGPEWGPRTRVVAHDAFGGAYLFANWEGTRRNNLHQLARVCVERRDETRRAASSRLSAAHLLVRSAAGAMASRRRRGERGQAARLR